MVRPEASEYPPFFQTYVDQVPEADILGVLEEQIDVVRLAAQAVPAEKERLAYGPGKWTIRQVFGHLVDSERVFGFRAFTFSRAEGTSLPGFDENAYVERASFDELPLAALIEDFVLLRSANLRMFGTLRDEQWPASGVANGRPITVRALAFLTAGHVRHHLRLLRERYGVPVESGHATTR